MRERVVRNSEVSREIDQQDLSFAPTKFGYCKRQTPKTPELQQPKWLVLAFLSNGEHEGNDCDEKVRNTEEQPVCQLIPPVVQQHAAFSLGRDLRIAGVWSATRT